MSFDYSTYVGPYARCAVERVPVTKLHITCPTEHCKNHGRDWRQPFCDLCGAKVATMPQIEIEDAIDDYEVSEAIDEALHTPGGDVYVTWTEQNAAHLWLPNRAMPGRDPYLDEREPFSLTEITAKQIDGEILQFQVTFESELATLREMYGNLSLHWGTIQYYS